ncbi:hypothetical protein [Shimia sp. Alg240-R146]|uniref:hypothetical protein n=1 Tax=Shimia sp. Alg240-R146 TaxID=2993449 RepID=UPI0022E15EBC|nr:hypothetical protein [Shimia sp. Alg240-R146]
MTVMKCFIVCNMFPALVSNVVRAPGLRAEQLAFQARPHFDQVQYLMLRSRYDLLCRGPQVTSNLTAHRDFLVIDDARVKDFLNRQPPSVFVFSQPEMAGMLSPAIKRHTVVYDILAPKELELRSGKADATQIATAKRRHQTFLKFADRVLVNGEKNRLLFESDLADQKDVVTNAFCPLTPPSDSPEPPKRDHILFFSSAQKWTQNTPFLDAMAELMETKSDVKAVLMSPLKHHEDPESLAISQLIQIPNVRRIKSLSYPAHVSLLERCAGVMDWSIVNDERVNSTSTRLIQAVGSGAAIFGNAGTGLDAFWGGYPGATSQDAPNAAKLEAFIDDALAGTFAPDLERAGNWNRQLLENPSVFGGL